MAMIKVLPGEFAQSYGGLVLEDCATALQAKQNAFEAVVVLLTSLFDIARIAFTLRLESLNSAVRYAILSMSRSIWFSSIIVLTLALAMASNITIFAIVRGVVFQPLPYGSPEKLVYLEGTSDGAPYGPVSLPDLMDVSSSTHLFKSVAGIKTDFDDHEISLSGHSYPAFIAEVTPDFFKTFDLGAARGSLLKAEDLAQRSEKKIVVSDHFWRTSLGSDERLIGRIITFGGKSARLIGVTSALFSQPDFPESNYDAYVLLDTMAFRSSNSRQHHNVQAFARLSDNETIAQSKLSLQNIFQVLRKRYSFSDAHFGIEPIPLVKLEIGDLSGTLIVIFTMVFSVLLIASANVANLLLGRGNLRKAEIALRFSFGASRLQIIAQLMLESLLLCLTAGVIGIISATVSIDLLTQIRPAIVPRVNEVKVDASTLEAALCFVAVATLLAGIWPALSVSRDNPAKTLKNSGRGVVRHRNAFARQSLIVVEVSLALVVIVFASLFYRGFSDITSQPLGFSSRNVSIISDFQEPKALYESSARQSIFLEKTIADIKQSPGIDSSAWSFTAPFTGNSQVVAYHTKASSLRLASQYNVVTSEYFHVLDIPLLAGRGFTLQDRGTGPGVIVVNRAFALKFFNKLRIVGLKLFTYQNTSLSGASLPVTIVGVVGDTRSQYGADPAPIVYAPMAQGSNADLATMLLIRGQTTDVNIPRIEDIIERAAPGISGGSAGTMDQAISSSMQIERVTLAILLTASSLALMYAIIGIFAVVSSSVSQRSKELALRISLGASTSSIIVLIMLDAMASVIVGIVVGLALCGSLAGFVAKYLFSIPPLDPVAFGLGMIAIFSTTFIAAFWPTFRASRVNLATSLRSL